jgi:hypothetical protein
VISAERKKAAIVAALSMIVAGCGGGGGGDGNVNNPAIATQPANVSVVTGDSATFTVTASGPDIRYQWQKNGIGMVGANAASYQTPPATYADDGTKYSVIVTNATGAVTSATAQLTLKSSANQAAFEGVNQPAGTYKLTWRLNDTQPQVSGANYALSDRVTMSGSPLTLGPMTLDQMETRSIAQTLSGGPFKRPSVLRKGAIIFLKTSYRVSYVGSDVRVESISDEDGTVAATEIRSNYETVALTGSLGATPADFAHFHSPFFSNPAILDLARVYIAGASYVKFTSTNKGDRYNVFDCFAANSVEAMRPCATGQTMNSLLINGFASASDATTYRLEDGAVRTIDGVPIWVANNPRPVSATLTSTVQYRIYFELNGNVYTGALIKDGAVLVGGSYVSNPNGATVADQITLLPFDIRMNKAAADSVAAAMKL